MTEAQELTDADRLQRLTRTKSLLATYSKNYVNFIWFTDEKLFTVATPKNPQNDRVYVPAGVKKRDVTAERLLGTRKTFSESVMVSAGVSKLGCTHLIFVDPGMKINGATTATSFSHANCCHSYARFLKSFSFSSRIALPHTEHEVL